MILELPYYSPIISTCTFTLWLISDLHIVKDLFVNLTWLFFSSSVDVLSICIFEYILFYYKLLFFFPFFILQLGHYID